MYRLPVGSSKTICLFQSFVNNSQCYYSSGPTIRKICDKRLWICSFLSLILWKPEVATYVNVDREAQERNEVKAYSKLKGNNSVGYRKMQGPGSSQN